MMKSESLPSHFTMEDEDDQGNKWLPTKDGGKFLALGELRRMY